MPFATSSACARKRRPREQRPNTERLSEYDALPSWQDVFRSYTQAAVAMGFGFRSAAWIDDGD
jgi:hypothetical protein